MSSISQPTPAPVHTERALTRGPSPTPSPPPEYASPLAAAPIPTSRASSPLPPIELRLETANVSSVSSNPRRHSKKDSSRSSGHWTGSGLDTDVPLSAGVHAMVHVPLTAHPDSEGAKVVKSPTQRDPIAMLLYLRRAVTLQTPPDKASKNGSTTRARRNSNASTSSETTAVGEQDLSKEKEFAEPWSAAGSFSHVNPTVPVQPKDVEAQTVERKSRMRKPLIIALIVLFLMLFLAAASLGIYSIVHHGF